MSLKKVSPKVSETFEVHLELCFAVVVCALSLFFAINCGLGGT